MRVATALVITLALATSAARASAFERRPSAGASHAIRSQLTARALARRGWPGYRPVILDLYEGPFRGLRGPLEGEWQAYLDGRLTRHEALRRIIAEAHAR